MVETMAESFTTYKNININKIQPYFSRLLFVLLIGLMTSSCSNTKYLAEGEKLYTGHDIKIKVVAGNRPGKKSKKALERELDGLIRPKRNYTIFGFLRPKLWFYNIAGKPKKEKGLRSFIKNKLGEPPVLWKDVSVENNIKLIENKLENRGYFEAQAEAKLKEKRKKVSVDYTAYIRKPPYIINKVIYPQGNDSISQYIRNTYPESLLIKEENYDLDILKLERIRIDSTLKNQGFFYFSHNYLLFQVDSTIGNRRVDIILKVKDDVPEIATKIFRINEIYINPNYSIRTDSLAQEYDTLDVRGYHYVRRDKTFRPRAIIRSVFLEKGEIYNTKDYEITLSRLMNMGTFKFVNIKFTDPDSGLTQRLNTYINLTPLPKRSLRLELRGVSKSNNFAGPGFIGSLRNRNLLRSAELFVFNINSSYETLIGGQQSGLNSYELGADVQLQLPRFVTPFNIRNRKSKFVPKTIFKLGFQRLSRVQYFDMNSFNFSFGYRWNETEAKQHELNPIVLNYLQLGHTSERFNELMTKNFLLQRSFQNQFILGGNYDYIYNTQVKGHRRNHFYFNGNVDVSGNILNLVQSITRDDKPTDEKPFEIFNAPYAQYSKATTDFRYYLNFDAKRKIATRIIIGVGAPYGNSSILPYAKQFFAGGNSSVRAFQARTLGPGSYRTPDSLRGGFFIDQAGDIKLETNLEYRFEIIGIFKGAVFADAGNIWLINDDLQRPGGKFEWNNFYNQLGIGTGAGLRLDAKFFVLRFDLAFPLRKPYLPDGEQWVGDDIRFGSGKWRGDNLVLNIAIGYPF